MTLKHALPVALIFVFVVPASAQSVCSASPGIRVGVFNTYGSRDLPYASERIAAMSTQLPQAAQNLDVLCLNELRSTALRDSALSNFDRNVWNIYHPDRPNGDCRNACENTVTYNAFSFTLPVNKWAEYCTLIPVPSLGVSCTQVTGQLSFDDCIDSLCPFLRPVMNEHCKECLDIEIPGESLTSRVFKCSSNMNYGDARNCRDAGGTLVSRYPFLATEYRQFDILPDVKGVYGDAGSDNWGVTYGQIQTPIGRVHLFCSSQVTPSSSVSGMSVAPARAKTLNAQQTQQLLDYVAAKANGEPAIVMGDTGSGPAVISSPTGPASAQWPENFTLLQGSLTDALIANRDSNSYPTSAAACTYGCGGATPGYLNHIMGAGTTSTPQGVPAPLCYRNGGLLFTSAVATTANSSVPLAPDFGVRTDIGLQYAAVTIARVSGDGQSASAAQPFAAPLQAKVTDSYGDPVGGVTVSFAGPASGPSAMFSPANGQATTSSNGIASITAIANTIAGGPYAVTASINGGTTVTFPAFSLTNTAGPAAVITKTAGDGGTALTGNLFVPNLKVRVTDQYGNPVPNKAVTFTVVPGPTGASGTFAPTPTQPILTGPDGTATAPGLAANGISGTFTVVASDPPPPLNTTFTLNIVKPATVPYLVSYAANLNTGDSYVNLTNFGTVSGNDPAGVICANLYVFDPNEEPVSCCSCPVTPNGLLSLSVRDHLVSRPLTGGTSPGAVVVKLLASAPVNGMCNAALPNTVTLARGIGAWMTTLHALTSTTPPTWQLTAPGFAPSELSDSELIKLRAVCGFIQTYASGFGLCRCK